MPRHPDPASTPARAVLVRRSLGEGGSLANGLTLAGLAGLAIVTLASPGATRMFAWPWSLAYAAALIAPALVLVARAFDARHPLILPAPAWCGVALASAAVVLASALASPHRGPSLLWSAPLLAGVAFFFVAFDARHANATRALPLVERTGQFFAVVALVSLALWAADLPGRSLAGIAAARNPYPLGHSNYTAGLALLALPWFVHLGLRAPRPARFAWAAAIALALAMLLTSGSRGGLLGLGTLAFAALLLAPLDRKRKLLLAAGCVLGGLALALAHPRTRAMFQPADPAAAPNVSNVQRAAMLTAGWRMGLDRPLLGWGPGTTPLVYPRYRAGLDGGAENVLQLHSTPVQLWAELGAPGVACAAFALALLLRPRRPAPPIVCQSLVDKAVGESTGETTVGCHPLIDNQFAAWAAAALAGYAVFSLTDWQLDVPVFAFAVALCAAQLAPPAAQPVSRRPGRALGLAILLALALVTLLGRGDPTPELNVRALALARDPAHANRAIALLRESLALDPDQEIAQFNLGWLLVVADPADAEQRFLAAARLVPDKGGVYFGLGLARLNQGRRDEAARAFALECLNDPSFLNSPWWREPAIAATRAATATEFTRVLTGAKTSLAPGTWAATQLPRVAALASQLGVVPAGPTRTYRRERTGYPVLMRNLDLPPPMDLFDVRESAAPLPASADSPPPKGWLPSPMLLQILDAPAPAIPKS